MIVWGFVVAGIGIVVSGMLSASRTALTAADHDHINENVLLGRAWASKAAAFLNNPQRFFLTARTGVELSFLAGSTCLIYSIVTSMGWWQAVVAMVFYIPLFILLGELLPKSVVSNRPSSWAPYMAWVVACSYWVFWPWITFQRLFSSRSDGSDLGNNHEREEQHFIRQELSRIISEGEEESESFQEERKLIDRIFQFSETQVRETMIPLVDVSALEDTAQAKEVLEKVDREGYSRFPVYNERIDNIVGIVHSLDFIDTPSLDEPIMPYIRNTPYVPESMPVDRLMIQLQRGGDHMAIVVDEYGGGVGIVTMEDLLEEIVGEIEDEHDKQRILFRKTAPGQYLVSGRMEIDKLNEDLGLGIPKEDFETLGGFLLKVFRKIPAEGESFTAMGVRYTVGKADERTIREVKISIPENKNGL